MHRLVRDGFSTVHFAAKPSALDVGTVLAQTPRAQAAIADLSHIVRLTVSAGAKPTEKFIVVPGLATCDFAKDRSHSCLGGPIQAKVSSN